MIASDAIVVTGFQASGELAAWRLSRKVLQTWTGPEAAVSAAQAGTQFDAANPAIVTDAVFRNPLREPFAIDVFLSSGPAECSFDGQPNFIAVDLLGQLAVAKVDGGVGA